MPLYKGVLRDDGCMWGIFAKLVEIRAYLHEIESYLMEIFSKVVGY